MHANTYPTEAVNQCVPCGNERVLTVEFRGAPKNEGRYDRKTRNQNQNEDRGQSKKYATDPRLVLRSQQVKTQSCHNDNHGDVEP